MPETTGTDKTSPGISSNIDCIVFSPHVDDEVLGCFSWLRPATLVVYGGVEERECIPREKRLQELGNAARSLGFDWQMLNNEVNSYRLADLVEPMEAAINQYQPNTVLLPEPSYNQDHRAFYDAALVATRPHDTNWQVNRVLMYEQPHSVIWPHSPQHTPNFFVPIELQKKLAAYALYDTQVRGHRSPETLSALAAMRGACISLPHAEAFYALRIIGQ